MKESTTDTVVDTIDFDSFIPPHVCRFPLSSSCSLKIEILCIPCDHNFNFLFSVVVLSQFYATTMSDQ